MSNQVVRVQGFSKGSLSGIGKEAERAEEVNHRNADIDPDRRYLNLAFKETQNGFYAEYHDIRTALNAQGKESKNAVAFEGMVITSDTAFFEGLGWEKGKPAAAKLLEYFRDSYEWAKTQIGYQGTDKNIMSAVVHMDETTPHLQLYYLPITEKWREKVYAKDETGKVLRTAKGVPVQAKGEDGKSLWNRCENSSAPKHSKVEFWYERGAQHSYRRMQDSYHENIGARYGLERGEIGSDREHTTKQQWQAQQLEKKLQAEIEPLRSVKINLDGVEELATPIVSTPLGVVVKKNALSELTTRVKAYELEIQSVREREQTLNALEQRANMQNIDITKRLNKLERDEKRWTMLKDSQGKIINQKTLELNKQLQAVSHLAALPEQYNNLVKVNQNLNEKVSSLQNEVTELKSENSKLREALSQLQTKFNETVQDLKDQCRQAYGYLKCAVQAVGQLIYGNKDSGYKVESITAKQKRLIDAVAEYGAHRAEVNGHTDYAKDMRERVSISDGISNAIKAKEERERPSRSYDYER